MVTVDRRNHGLSDHPTQGQDLHRHAMDIECVLFALGIEEVSLVGSSMGASVIWAYVDSFGTGRVRSIVSVDQTPRMVNDVEWKLGLHGLTAAGVDEFVAGFPATVATDTALRRPPPDEVLELVAASPPFSFDGSCSGTTRLATGGM